MQGLMGFGSVFLSEILSFEGFGSAGVGRLGFLAGLRASWS